MKKILLPVILLILFLVFFLPRFFIKVGIACHSQYGDCPPSVLEKIYSLNGKSLFVASRELKKNLKTNFFVSDFGIQFKLPNILRVDIVAKKPVYALKNKSSGMIALIDKDGSVLYHSEAYNLPLGLTDEELPKIGDKVSSTNLLALELLAGVNKMYQTNVGEISPLTLVVDLPVGIRVIFPLVNAQKDLLLGSLRLIYSNIQKDGKLLYSQVDLRYKNPVLR